MTSSNEMKWSQCIETHTFVHWFAVLLIWLSVCRHVSLLAWWWRKHQLFCGFKTKCIGQNRHLLSFCAFLRKRLYRISPLVLWHSPVDYTHASHIDPVIVLYCPLDFVSDFEPHESNILSFSFLVKKKKKKFLSISNLFPSRKHTNSSGGAGACTQ